MSSFKMLKDVSNSFDKQLQQLSNNLFCARVGECPEEVVAKKLTNLCLFSSKYHLLHAKEIASTPETAERVQNSDPLAEYDQTAQKCVLERAAVKSLVRSRAVQKLLTTPDRKLDPQLLDRKGKILERMSHLRTLDSELRHIDSVLLEQQKEAASLRRQWDEALGELRDRALAVEKTPAGGDDGPLQSKLSTIVEKLELMRRLMARLVTARGTAYDWLADPQQRASALGITRRVYSVEAYTSDKF